MTWVAVAIAGGAVVGAIANKSSADAANKPKKNWTDQTSTQTPYLSDQTLSDTQAILAGQRGIYQQGAPQIVPDGRGGYKVVYASVPTGEQPADPGRTGPRSSLPNANGQVGAGAGGGMTNLRASSSSAGTVTRPDGRVVPAVAGGARPRTTAAAGSSAAASPAHAAVSSPDAIFRQTAAAGLQAGNDPTTRAAQSAVQNILASQAADTAAGGTGFAGYNNIDNTLTKQLQGQVSSSQASNLLNQFLAASGYDTTGAGGSAGAGGGLTPGQIAAQARGYVSGANGGISSPVGMGGVVPDATGDGVFGSNIKALLGGQTDQADLQALLDKSNKDAMAQYWQMAAQQDAAAQGGGRFGGSQAEYDKTLGEKTAMGEIAGKEAATRYQDYNDQRSAALQALGLVNTRDLGAMSDATNRAQIAAQLAASAGASGAAAATARRGQDLNAIQSILQNQQFGENQLAGLGGQLSGDEATAIGHAPGLASVAAQGLAEANSAGSGMVAQQNADTSARSVNQQGALARAGMNLNLAEYNAGSPQSSVNNYLATILRIGGMGGTSTVQGQNVVAGAGISPTGAALTGALGGAAQGYGLYNTATGYGGIGYG